MIQIICLIIGIIYALRRPKLKALGNSAFPDVPADKFEEWKRLELQSINYFLWASWGVFLLSIIATMLLGSTSPGGALGLQIVFLVVFLLLLVIAAVFGSKAAKLKKQFGIKWP